MKLLLLSLPFFLFSCSQYQYLTLNSDDTPRNANNEFQFENEDVKITYNFYGSNAPIEVKIYNKSLKGLNVDWSKSSLIIGEKAITFNDQVVDITGQLTRSSSSPRINSTSSLSATATTKEAVVFIPPQSAVDRSGLKLVNGDFFTKSKNPVEAPKSRPAGSRVEKKTLSTFKKDESPLQFRIYLTLDPGDPGKSFAVDRSFYLSELYESSRAPGGILSKERSGNRAYISKISGGKALIYTLGAVTALLTINIIAEH